MLGGKNQQIFFWLYSTILLFLAQFLLWHWLSSLLSEASITCHHFPLFILFISSYPPILSFLSPVPVFFQACLDFRYVFDTQQHDLALLIGPKVNSCTVTYYSLQGWKSLSSIYYDTFRYENNLFLKNTMKR